jgi:hypothetical protein
MRRIVLAGTALAILGATGALAATSPGGPARGPVEQSSGPVAGPPEDLDPAVQAEAARVGLKMPSKPSLGAPVKLSVNHLSQGNSNWLLFAAFKTVSGNASNPYAQFDGAGVLALHFEAQPKQAYLLDFHLRGSRVYFNFFGPGLPGVSNGDASPTNGHVLIAIPASEHGGVDNVSLNKGAGDVDTFYSVDVVPVK